MLTLKPVMLLDAFGALQISWPIDVSGIIQNESFLRNTVKFYILNYTFVSSIRSSIVSLFFTFWYVLHFFEGLDIFMNVIFILIIDITEERKVVYENFLDLYLCKRLLAATKTFIFSSTNIFSRFKLPSISRKASFSKSTIVFAIKSPRSVSHVWIFV